MSHTTPTRYSSKMVDLTFWKTLRQFFHYGFWSSQAMEWTAIRKGEPGYEEAPFEDSFVFHSDVLTVKLDGKEANE